MNFNETNGICIGPELSRVFAEVILSAVDAEIVRRARTLGYRVGREFEYRRYVDDFNIFGVNSAVLSSITTIMEDCLGEYNLHLNEEKRATLRDPLLLRSRTLLMLLSAD
jgi:hypothetical protein